MKHVRKTVKSIPRIAWIAGSGMVALLAVLLLMPPPGPLGVEASGKRDRNSVRSSGEADAAPSLRDLESSPLPRPLATYNRLRQRNLFRPLVSDAPAPSALAPLEAPLGLLPMSAGVGGLPPAGSSPFVLSGKGKPLPSQKSLGPWTFVGYVTEDGVPKAVLENKKERLGRGVGVGDRVEGAMVTGISRSSIRLMRNDQAFLLLLVDPLEAAKNAPSPPAVGGPGAAPGSPPSGPPKPGGPTPAGPAGSPPPPNSGGPPRPNGAAAPPAASPAPPQMDIRSLNKG